MNARMLGSFPLAPIELAPGVRIETPVILAPMSGITDLPFRRLARAQGTGLVVSEMIASQAMIRQNRQSLMMADVDGGTASTQLAGSDPAVMAEAAKLVVLLGAAIVDINFGCPAPTVNSHDSGRHEGIRDPSATIAHASWTHSALPK